nr:TetR/AcrR family transcriptional regulator [Cohnella sp. WQ 127256]
MSKTDRRVHKSRSALKQALLEWMSHKPFSNISISDIVKTADLNRGTFYKHYIYKEDLLNDILDDVITDLIRSYRAPYLQRRDFDVQSLNASAIKIFDHVYAYANVYTLMVRTNILSDFRDTINQTLKSLYLNDVTDMSPNPKINKELLACYQAHAVLGLITEWVQCDFKYSSSYMAEQLLEFTRMNRANEEYRSNLSLA